MRSHMSDTSVDDRVVWAAICTATCGLLRLGELTSSGSAGNRATLRMQDLTLVTREGACLSASDCGPSSSIEVAKIGHLALFIPASKTDPFSSGATIVIAAPLAMSAVVAMLRQADADPLPSAPLFAEADGRSLRRRTVIDRTRILLTAIGQDASEYAGHSFRKGGASSLAAAGVPDHLIQTMGRWASDCYKLYIELPTERLVEAGRKM
jgi:hypothetical protein